jgi:hypothetical protein
MGFTKFDPFFVATAMGGCQPLPYFV